MSYAMRWSCGRIAYSDSGGVPAERAGILASWSSSRVGLRQTRDVLANPIQAFRVVGRAIMGNGADRRMRHGPAEELAVDDLAGRALDEIRSSQPHERGAFHHVDHVGQGRQVRAARNALPHDCRDLGHMQVAPHDRVVVEDARRPVLAREDAPLVREIHARGVHEVDDRNPLTHRHFLRAEDLLDRLRPPGTGFDRRVIRDDHDLASGYLGDAGHDPGPGGLPVVLVVGDEESQLEPGRVRITQALDPLPRRQLSLVVLLLDAIGATPELQGGRERAVDVRELAEAARPLLRGHACRCATVVVM